MTAHAMSSHVTGPEQYCYFFEEEHFEETERAGFRRRIIRGEHLELWFWRISGGTGGSVLHNHPGNEQIGIILRGALDFRIGDPDDPRRVTLRAGEVYLASMNVWHGDSNFIGDDELNEVWILDVFSPPRTDGGAESTKGRITRGEAS